MDKYQERYWQELYDLKVHATYLEIYLLKTEKIDKRLNAFLAIASSASIASWVMWKEYQIVWASIIVLSQFINAIKPFIPFNSRIKTISKALKEMELLSIKYEKKWFYIAEGDKTTEETNNLRFEIKEKKLEIMKRYFTIDILPTKKQYLEEAENITQSNIKNYYKED